eukprot:c21343_g1_i1 orf=125-2200(+)
MSRPQVNRVPAGGLSYPARFLAAAAYAGFGSLTSPDAAVSQYSHETGVILYALYQQASVGPCNVPQPRRWHKLEQDKWNSWKSLGNMASVEAMRLFVKILEEEDPAWLSKVQNQVSEEPSNTAVESNSQEVISSPSESIPLSSNGSALENGNLVDTEDKDVLVEGIAAISVYNHWVCPQISGRRPSARYQHAAAVIQDKMYIVGGNHNGRYLNDVQVFDLNSLTWSKVEQKSSSLSSPQSAEVFSAQSMLPPCAGHSLIQRGSELLAVAGHSKDPFETVVVRSFDTMTCCWSLVESYGKSPIARGGQSITLVGSSLVMFGGEDSRRHLLNDLNILDLETMTWETIEAVGTPPSPRSDHTATVQGGRYLLIFGGGSHSTCFNDLHVLDLESMEWSQPEPQGILPAPRAGHAGVMIGDNWYIIGGGDNKSGICETMVLNTSTLVWSVATGVQGRTSIASEGLSVVSATSNGEEILITFGGYNGRYSNEVHIMKTNQKAKLQPRILESPAAAAAAFASQASLHPRSSANGVSVNGDSELHVPGDITQENRVKEIVIDNPKSETSGYGEVNDQLAAALKSNQDLEASSLAAQSENARLKHELASAQSKNSELSKELHSVRTQLVAEQSRCFRLEVEVAELRQKLQSMELVQKELELLRRQQAASDAAAATVTQKQGSGMWSWLAGTPPDGKSFQA